MSPWWLLLIVPASVYGGFVLANHLWVRAGAVVPRRRTPNPYTHVSEEER